MLDKLLDMLGDGDDGDEGDRGCCQQRQQPRTGGIRGMITRLFNGDDSANGNDGECCQSGARDRYAGSPGAGRGRRDRDDRDDGFDFGD